MSDQRSVTREGLAAALGAARTKRNATVVRMSNGDDIELMVQKRLLQEWDREDADAIFAALPIELDVEHPEAHCGRCGGPNPSWHAASPLWNAVMRIGESEPFDGIVCPSCFVFLAAEAGVAEYLCVTAHGTKVPLATTMGDRVWDAATCMWVVAAGEGEP